MELMYIVIILYICISYYISSWPASTIYSNVGQLSFFGFQFVLQKPVDFSIGCFMFASLHIKELKLVVF